MRRLFSDGAFAWALSALFVCTALANGGYDLWAATAVYLAVLALVAVFVARAAWAQEADGLDLSLLPPLGLCLLAFGISTMRAGNPAAAFQGYSDWCAAFAVFWVSRHVFRGPEGVDAVTAMAASAVWVELAVNVKQQVGAFAPFREQMGGTLVNANFAACFVVVCLPVLVSKAWRSRGDRAAWFWRATVAAAFVKLWLTYSLWGMMTAAAVLPLLAGPGAARTWPWRYVRTAAIGVAAVLAVAAIGYLTLSRVTGLFGGVVEGNEYRRFQWWLTALRMFAAEPVFGVGPANFSSAFLAFRSGAGQHTHLAHSLLLTLLSEVGLAGTGALLGAAEFWRRRFWTSPRALEERWPFAVGLAGFLVCTLVLPGVELLAIQLTAAVFAGVCLAREDVLPVRPRRSVALVAAAAAAALATDVVRPFFAGRLAEAARAELSAGRFESALEAGRSAVAVYPRSSDAHRMAAQASAGLFRRDGAPFWLDEAIESQRRAASLNRHQGVPLMELGLLHRLRGDHEEAVRLLRQADRLDHNNPAIRRELEGGGDGP